MNMNGKFLSCNSIRTGNIILHRLQCTIILQSYGLNDYYECLIPGTVLLTNEIRKAASCWLPASGRARQLQT